MRRYACSVSDFERHQKGKENEWYTVLLLVNYLAEEVCSFPRNKQR